MISGPALTNKLTPKEMTEQGRQFEEDFFGERPKVQDLSTVCCGTGKSFHKNLFKVIEVQRTLFKWDPRNPKTELARKLFNAVKERLSRRVRAGLHLCCALGTPLDYMHGIDGFFFLWDNQEKPVTFDLARAGTWAKRMKLQANLLITIEDMDSWKTTQHIGAKISTKLAMFWSQKENGLKRRKDRPVRLQYY